MGCGRSFSSLGITASAEGTPWVEGLALPNAVPGSGSLDILAGVGYLPGKLSVGVLLWWVAVCFLQRSRRTAYQSANANAFMGTCSACAAVQSISTALITPEQCVKKDDPCSGHGIVNSLVSVALLKKCVRRANKCMPVMSRDSQGV